MRLRLVDSNLFYLKGTKNKFLHLATIHRGAREFVCFMGIPTRQVYIEEITGGHLKRIEDTGLATELEVFCQSTGIINVERVEEFLIGQALSRSSR